jgi:glycosidase
MNNKNDQVQMNNKGMSSGRDHLQWMILLPLTLFIVMGCAKDEKKLDTIYPGSDVPVQYDVPFTHVPAVSDIVLYEVNERAFSTSADIKGVQGRLDSIKNLGINVIWLMPIYPIGELNGIGSPYAVKNYKEVNADYGTLEDLRTLVKESHQRGMAVILDWVANHTAWDNPWLKNKSWYTQDANGQIISPLTWTDVADLNYSSHAMRQEMIKAMKYWVLEANVDGYRCDYADGVPDDFWADAIDTLRHIPNRNIIMFAEARNKSLFQDGFDLTFGWSFYEKLKAIFNQNVSVSELSAVNATDYAGVPQGSHIVRWISNHDDDAWDDTPLGIFQGIDGAMAAFVLTSYMGGVPLIYNGQEVGCPTKLSFFKGGNTKINWSLHPEVTAAYKKLIGFRNESSAVRNGSLLTMDTNADVLTFKRTVGAEEVLVMVNVRNKTVNYTLPSAVNSTHWINALNGDNVELGNTASMAPFQYVILKN